MTWTGNSLLRWLIPLAAVGMLLPVTGCTQYDVPGGDRPWPKLHDFPERPDAAAMEKRRRFLLGQYGDPAEALAQPRPEPATPPPGALEIAAIQFPRGQAELDAGSREVLAQIAAYAQQSRATVWLFGYTSQRIEIASGGSVRESSANLAAQRVRRTALALLELGVPADRLELVARGRADPRYRETTEPGEAGNRRVEIYLVR